VLDDHSVSRAAVARAERRVRASGLTRTLHCLEEAEPDLAEHLMESATRLYGRLDRACPSHRRVRAIHTDAVLLTLICIEALRRST
jgi:hypothetical protein